MKFKSFFVAISCVALLGIHTSASAQEALPEDNGPYHYHEAPNYRESESHPLRILGYIFHPVGWALREGIFRPISYFASSTKMRRSVMGYRDPYDYRDPYCFNDTGVPDCHSVAPFNYGAPAKLVESESAEVVKAGGDEVYFPDVNFDFNRHTLTPLGVSKVHAIHKLLQESPNLRVVLEGNTDYVGSDSYNLKLGMNRAETVRQELVRLGVSSDRLSAVTFGESQPLFAEHEDWARAANRRVAAKVTSHGNAAK